MLHYNADKSGKIRVSLIKGGERMKKDVCTVCGYVYDPQVGDPDSGVPAGTPFAEVASDWVCPICGVGKDMFETQ